MTDSFLADFAQESLGNREIAANEILQWARKLGDGPERLIESLIGFLEETRYELFASPAVTARLNDHFGCVTEPPAIDKLDTGIGAPFILATKAFQSLSAVAMQAAVDLAKERSDAAEAVSREAGIRRSGEPRSAARTRQVFADENLVNTQQARTNRCDLQD